MLPDPRPYFSHLSDPRRETRNKLHKLEDILMIVFGAVLSGIPSHDTLGDVIGRLEPGAFAGAFLCWVNAAVPSLAGERASVADSCHVPDS